MGFWIHVDCKELFMNTFFVKENKYNQNNVTVAMEIHFISVRPNYEQNANSHVLIYMHHLICQFAKYMPATKILPCNVSFYMSRYICTQLFASLQLNKGSVM